MRTETVNEAVTHLLGLDGEGLPGDVPLIEMGADSIIFMKLAYEIQRRTGVKLETRRFFEDLLCIDDILGVLGDDIDPAPAGDVPAAESAVAAVPSGTVEPRSGDDRSVGMQVDELRSKVAGVLAGILGLSVEEVDPDEAMLALGADSIAFTRLAHEMGSVAGVRLETRRFFEDLISVNDVVDEMAPEGRWALAADIAPSTPQRPALVPRETHREAAADCEGAKANPVAVAPPAQRAVAESQSERSDSQGLSRDFERFTVAAYQRFTSTSRNYAGVAQTRLANNRRIAPLSHFVSDEIRYPLVIRCADGAMIEDLDGNRYIDLSMGFGAHLLGHRPSFVVEALEKSLDLGFAIGPASPLPAAVAHKLSYLTGHERMLFCVTGTEATMTALRLARAASGRPETVIFNQCYHGHFDGTLGVPDDGPELGRTRQMVPGVNVGSLENVLSMPFTKEALEYVERNASRIGVVMVEPVQNASPGERRIEFLQELRRITREADIPLVFDEVLTGLRVHPAGAQGLFGITPDISTYGKCLAAGMPIAAVAGSRRFLDLVDGGAWLGTPPVHRDQCTFTAGTYANHPLSMASADAVLTHLNDAGPKLQRDLNARGDRLIAALNEGFYELGCPLGAANFGSFFRFAEYNNYSFANQSSRMDTFRAALAMEGVYVAESGASFISTAHDDGHLDAIVAAAMRAASAAMSGGLWAHARASRPQPAPTPSRGPSVETPPVAAHAGSASPVEQPAAARIRMTPQQTAVYLASEFSEESTLSYTMGRSFAVRGDLGVDALRTALLEIQHRHQALRARVSRSGDELVLDAADLALEVMVDPTAKAVQDWWDTEISLGVGPVIGALLCRRGQNPDEIHLKWHHLCVDGASEETIISELGRLLDGKPLEAAVDDLESACMSVPSHKEKPRKQGRGSPLSGLLLRSFTGRRITLPFSPDIVTASRTIGARLNSSPYMVVLAAFARGVHLVCKSSSVGIGIAVDVRSIDQEGLVGHFTDFRKVCSLDRVAADFDQHVDLIKREMLRVLDAACGESMDETPPSLWGAPDGIDAVFNWDKVTVPRSSGLEFLPITGRETNFVRFDLGADVQHIGNRHEISWDFNPERFDAHTIVWLHNFIEATLSQAVAAEEVSGVVELLSAATLASPDRPAWIGDSDAGALTVAQVAARARETCCQVLSGGTKIGTPIRVTGGTFADTVVAVLGTLLAGGVASLDLGGNAPTVGSGSSSFARCDVVSPGPVVDCGAWAQHAGGMEWDAGRVSEAAIVRTINALKAASGPFEAGALGISLADRPRSLPLVVALGGCLGGPAAKSI